MIGDIIFTILMILFPIALLALGIQMVAEDNKRIREAKKEDMKEAYKEAIRELEEEDEEEN